MKALRIGVIGLGDIAHAYLSNLQKYPDAVELYACACRTPAKAQAKKEEYGF
ncbi:MAG TPA: oxidoreductase, partial [Sarcina sp.]|nr:oxidoreductase [Sarcina sp.]